MAVKRYKSGLVISTGPKPVEGPPHNKVGHHARPNGWYEQFTPPPKAATGIRPPKDGRVHPLIGINKRRQQEGKRALTVYQYSKLPK